MARVSIIVEIVEPVVPTDSARTRHIAVTVHSEELAVWLDQYRGRAVAAVVHDDEPGPEIPY